MKYILLFSTVLFSLNTHAAIDFENAKSGGETCFLAVGKPAMIKIKGHSPAPKTIVKVENNKMSVESIVALNDLETGIGMRDEHMKDNYLQTKQFPNAVLKIENIPVADGFEAKPFKIKEQSFEGKLTLHGKEQKVSGTFSLSDSLELVANFSFKLSDYGIEIPEYLGITVADQVKVDTEFKLVKK